MGNPTSVLLYRLLTAVGFAIFVTCEDDEQGAVVAYLINVAKGALYRYEVTAEYLSVCCDGYFGIFEFSHFLRRLSCRCLSRLIAPALRTDGPSRVTAPLALVGGSDGVQRADGVILPR